MPLLNGVRRHSILSRLTNTEGYPGPGCVWAELSTAQCAEPSASTYFCPRLYIYLIPLVCKCRDCPPAIDSGWVLLVNAFTKLLVSS